MKKLMFNVSRDAFMYLGCMLHIAEDMGDSYGLFKLDAIEVTTIKKNECGDQHPLSLTDDDAQGLLQALWNAGYRPNNGESSMAHVESMKNHLEDMRKLVFRNQYEKQ